MAKLGYALMVLIFALIVGAFSACTFGHVSGEEFDPVTFDRREFDYWEVPLIQLQVWPTVFTTTTAEVESYLQAEKLIPPVAQKKPADWDLVQGHRNTLQVVKGDAAVLCSYFDVQLPGGGHTWVQWSIDHPKRAVTLWKEVAWLARERLYYRIPDLMDLAKGVNDKNSTAEFQQQVDRRMAGWLAEIADIHRRNDDVPRAAELLAAALQRQPDDPRLQAAQAALPTPRAEAGG